MADNENIPELDTIKPLSEATEPEDTSLDAAIAKALGGDEPASDAPATDSRARDEKGRFASSKPEAEGGTDAPAAEAPAVETAAPVEAKPVEAQAPKWTDGHFAGWKPEQRERFNALPPDVQQLVMDRQAESQAFFQRKISESDSYRQAAEPLVQAAQKVEPFARSIGVRPDELLTNYAALDYQLRYAPYAEKVKLLGQIAASYGLPYAQPEPDPYADPLQPNGQAYPVIHDLQSQVRQLQSQLQSYQQSNEQATNARVEQEIAAFTSQKLPDGSPKYPLFEQVRASMGQLITGGQAKSLDEAYAIATKPIMDFVAQQAQTKAKQATEAQAAAVQRAKKAAPIRASGMAPNGKMKGGGLDAVLEQSLAQFSN